jgi:hypothetical protein
LRRQGMSLRGLGRRLPRRVAGAVLGPVGGPDPLGRQNAYRPRRRPTNHTT